MITNELNGLLNEFVAKKDVLDNHTDTIVKEIREWCLKEDARIKQENKNLLDFFVTNWINFKDDFHNDTCYRWKCMNISIHTKQSYRAIPSEFDSIEIDEDYQYKHNCGRWSKLQKPNIGSVGFEKEFGLNDDSLDYWLDVKRVLAIRNETLNILVKLIKDYLNTKIMRENKRKDEMFNACGEIARNDVEEVSVTLKVRNRD